jgi:hypothetical protein
MVEMNPAAVVAATSAVVAAEITAVAVAVLAISTLAPLLVRRLQQDQQMRRESQSVSST